MAKKGIKVNAREWDSWDEMFEKPVAPAGPGMGALRQAESAIAEPPSIAAAFPESMGSFRQKEGATPLPIAGMDYEVPPPPVDRSIIGMEEISYAPTSEQRIANMSDFGKSFDRGVAGVVGGAGGALRMLGMEDTGRAIADQMEYVNESMPQTRGEINLQKNPFTLDPANIGHIFTPEFWTDGRLVASFANAAGSSAPFLVGSMIAAVSAPVTGSVLTTAAITRIGQAALSTQVGRATIGKIVTNPLAQKAFQNTIGRMGDVGKAFVAARVASSGPEAWIEGGGSYNEMAKWNGAVSVLRDPNALPQDKSMAKETLKKMYEQNGGKGELDTDHAPTIDDAKWRAWKQTILNMPLLAVSNAVEAVNILSPAKNIITGTARKMAFGAAQGSGEEFGQEGAGYGVPGVGTHGTPLQGEEFVWSLDPRKWNANTRNAVAGGGMFGGVMGAMGGGAGPSKLKIGDVLQDDERGPVKFIGMSPEGMAVFQSRDGDVFDSKLPKDLFDPSVFAKSPSTAAQPSKEKFKIGEIIKDSKFGALRFEGLNPDGEHIGSREGVFSVVDKNGERVLGEDGTPILAVYDLPIDAVDKSAGYYDVKVDRNSKIDAPTKPKESVGITGDANYAPFDYEKSSNQFVDTKNKISMLEKKRTELQQELVKTKNKNTKQLLRTIEDQIKLAQKDLNAIIAADIIYTTGTAPLPTENNAAPANPANKAPEAANPLASDAVVTGPAVWNSKDGDVSVNITGLAGEKDGVQYVNVEGSNTAIPLNEISPAVSPENESIPVNIPSKEQSTIGNFAVGDKVTSSKGSGVVSIVTKTGVGIKTADGKRFSVAWNNVDKFGLKKEDSSNSDPANGKSSVSTGTSVEILNDIATGKNATRKGLQGLGWEYSDYPSNGSVATKRYDDGSAIAVSYIDKGAQNPNAGKFEVVHWVRQANRNVRESDTAFATEKEAVNFALSMAAKKDVIAPAEKPRNEVKSDKIKVGDTVTRPGKNDGFVVVDDSDPSMFVIKTPQGGTLKTGKKGVVKSGSAADVATVDPNQKQKDAFAVAYRSFEEASKLSEQAKTDSSIENPWPEVIKLLGETIHAQNVGDARIDEQARKMMKEAERASAAFGGEKNEQVEALKHSVGDKVTVSGEKGEATVTAVQGDNVVVEMDSVGVSGTKTTTIPAKDAVTIDTPESKYRKAIKYDKADSETKAKYDMNYTHIKNILDEKDSYKKYAGLRDSFISNDNKRWMAAYDAITGETIPRKQGERLKYLQDKYPEEHKRLMNAKADKRAKSDAEMRRARINGTKVNHNGKIIGRADFIDSAIEGGYRKAVKRPQGAAFVYHLMGDNGKGYVLANKEEFIYASEKIDEINDAAIPDDLEVDALFENPAVTETPTSPVAEETQPEQAEAIDAPKKKADISAAQQEQPDKASPDARESKEISRLSNALKNVSPITDVRAGDELRTIIKDVTTFMRVSHVFNDIAENIRTKATELLASHEALQKQAAAEKLAEKNASIPEKAEASPIDKKEEKSDNGVEKSSNEFDANKKAALRERLMAKKKPPKLVDIVDDSDEALAAAADRFSKAISKLSANPVFDPDVMDAALEIGLIHIQRGVNNFGQWSEKMIKTLSEKVKPYLPSTWSMINNFPSGEKYDQETVRDLFEYAGIKYEEGTTEYDAFSKAITDDLGDEFEPYVKMAYEGIISWKEATTSEYRSEGATDNRLPEAASSEEASPRGSDRDNKADSGAAGENLGDYNEPASGTAAGPERNANAEVSAKPDRSQRDSAKPNVGKRKTGVRNQNYVITEKDQLGKGGPVQKYNDNIAAIKLIKKLNEENRQATPEEKAVLVKYVGWGGFPQLFDSYLRPDNDWYARSKELKELLSSEEYAAARASTTNAHYTSETVVRAIWDGVKRLGFSGGKVLEPSMGTGNFFGMIPKEIQNSSLTGVELDPLTGAIAKQLYQDASIHITGFEKAPLPEEYYDLAISNVPFGDYTLHDPKYNKYKLNIHNYFFVKALDKVRPGGLVVFITGTGTMQSDRQKAVRSMIAGRAELLGAIKMPNTAFKENARTEVTTDVLFLRKLMPDEAQTGHSWGELAGTGIRSAYTYKEMQVNEYFTANPDMMLGELYEDKLHQGRLGLKDNGKDLGDMLKKAIAKLPKGIYAQSSVKAPTVMDISKMIDAPGTAREGSVQIQDGKVHIVTSGKMVPKEMDAKRVKAVSSIVSIREQVRELMRAQLDPNTSDDILTHRRATLKKTYDQYVKENGYLAASKNKTLFDDDPDSGLVFALEQYPDKKAAPVLSDIFTTRTIQPYRRATEVSTPEEALISSLQETGRVDIARMSALLNKPEETIIQELEGQIFHDPASGKWEQRELYLSGNVRQKLVAAKEAAKTDKKYAINVSELESVQPTDLEPHEIKAKLGSPWIPASDIERFIDHIVGTNNFVSVKHDDLSNTWLFNESNVRSWQRPDNTRNYQTWGTSRYSAVDLIEAILNSRQINVKDKDSDGKPYVNDKETAAAQDKAENIKKEFNEWVWKDKERSERLAREYNDNFNAVRLPEYNGEHLQIPGLTTRINLRPHQKNAIWRIIQGGNSLIAHGVGLGKTLVMQAAGMKLRQLGLSRKPLYVLPNATISDFETKFREHFPAAKILVLSSKTLPPEVAVMKKESGPTTVTTKEGVVHERFDDRKNAGSVNPSIDNAKTAERIQARRAILSRIATEDWDAVLITHNMFTRLPMSPRIMAEHIKRIISDYYAAIESAKAESGNSKWVKDLEKQVKRWEAELEAALSADTKSIVTPFDELGIDYLFVDEADVFKNLGFATKMGRIAGVQNGNAKRSFDMYAKTSYLNKANRSSGVVFATGTPISNTIGEMFTMMRYLIPQRLRELNIGHFDTWAANFGETIASFERDVAGKGYRTVERFAKFVNAPELIRLFREFADVKRAEDVNLPLPTLRTGSWQTVVSPMPEALKKYIDTDITARVNAIRSGAVKPDADNMLVVTSDLRKAALDIRLVLPGVRLAADSKINKAVDNIFRIWSETKEKRSTQIVFCDLSIPKAEKEEVSEELESDEFEVEAVDASVYQTIQRMLVDKGVPKEEIVFIHDAKNNKQKQALFDKMNSGEVRVLIGSTGKAGVGLNVQNKLIAAHHLDVPWRPRDLEQRNGRIVRQGNENEEVDVYAYATEGSADSLMWERVAMKQRFIQHAMSGNLTDREIVEDDLALGFAEISAITSGNPLLAEKVKLENQVTRLRLLREKHESDKLGYRIKQERTLPHDIKKAKEGIAKVEKDIAARKETSGDKFAAEINGMSLTDRKAAEDVLNSFIEENTYSAKSGEESVSFVSPEIIDKEIGSIGGMMIVTRKTGDDHQAYTITKKSGESLEVQKGQIRLVLKGPSGRTYPVTTPTINGIENRLRRIDDFLKEAQTELSNLESSKAEIQKLIDKPFDRESEYQKLNSRLDDVLKELAKTDKPDEAGAKLNSGIDPFQLIPGLRKYSDMTAKEAFNDLVAIGRKVFEETTHGGKWMARMKELLGDLWGKAKSIMGKVWNEVKRTVKSNRGSIRLSTSNKTDSLGFYSATKRAIEAMDFKSMPAADLINRITKTAGIKQEELDDLGIIDWLNGQDDKVTKEQVLAFVEQGGPRIEEIDRRDGSSGFVWYDLNGREEIFATRAEADRRYQEERQWILDDSTQLVEDEDAIEILDSEMNTLNRWEKRKDGTYWHTEDREEYADRDDAMEVAKEVRFNIIDGWLEELQPIRSQNPLDDDGPKFAQYQLPGGENYREVLLTLPVTENDFLQWLEKNRDENRPYYGSEEEFITGMRTVFEKNSDYKKRSGGDFRSSHWSEPNVLAHFRLNDRTVDGKKVLFIEEIQSDWHQKGKKEGYKEQNEKRLEEIYKEEDYIKSLGSKATEGQKSRLNELIEEHTSIRQRMIDYQPVPDAPFKSTPAWSMLAFKRILRMAVEQGYDSVAWTPGEVQAERYDLSKYISDVLYVKNTDGTYDVRAYDDRTGQMVNSKENATIREVEDFIGKDIATKIEKGEGRKDNLGLHLPEETMALSGLDLKVGGEGMKGFYDRILPAEVGKYIKKLDKDAKVGTSTVNKKTTNLEYRVEETNGIVYGRTYKDGNKIDGMMFESREEAEKWVQAKRKASGGQEVWSIPITDKMRGEVMSGQALYSFPANIAHIIPGLSKYNDMTAPEAFRDLVRIGTAAYESGITNGGKWVQKMREILGSVWAKAKPVIGKVWNEVKKAVSNNRGAIRLGGKSYDLTEVKSPAVVVPADTETGGRKTVEQLVENGWMSRTAQDGSSVLVRPQATPREVPDSFTPVIPGMDRNVAFEFEQSSEVPEIPTGEKLRDSMKKFWAYASRKYSTLPRSAEFAPLEFGLTQLEHKKGVATDTTVKTIQGIVSTLKNKKDYQIFSHKVVFDDIAADLKADPEYKMPFGLTQENFQEQYDAVNAAVTPEIQQAIDARKEAWTDFKEKYVASMKAIGFNVEDRLKKGDTYFHHIVLDYAELKKRLDPVLGTQIRTPSYRGFLKSREGSTKNILTDYLQPEMEVMGQMMYDVEIAKVIKMVSDKYDIQSDLKKIATASNEFNTIKSLIDEKGEIDGMKSWNQLSKKQAMAMSRLAELAFNDELPNNGKFDDVLDALTEAHSSGEQLELPKNRLFAYLTYLMNADSDAGKMAAGLMFKGIKEKAAAIKERLGDEHLSWRDLIPEGYEPWQPREGNIFYTGYTIPEHIAQGIAEKAVSELGVPADKVRRVMLQGGKRREMVVPVEVASTLEEIVPAHAYRSWVLNGLTHLQGKWKQAVLQMPNRFLSYNFNNMVGDLDAVIAAQGHKAMRKTMTAARELYGVFYKGKEMSPLMKEWFNRGGFETLLQTQEAGKVNQLATFDRLMEREKKLSKLPLRVWQSYWHGARKATDFREAIMRYAKFLDYVEQMKGTGVPSEFGASDPNSVMALDNEYDRAFKLSNELLGAYDSISEMGRDMRSFIWPFWSWKEVNATRYAQMIKNATVDSKTAQDVAVAIGGQALRRAPFAAIKAGAFMVKAAFLWALIQSYNWWMWPGEERDLEDGVKYKMHVILGRDQDGKVRYVKASGAFADILGWVSLDTPMQHYDAWLSGRKSLKQIATDMATAPTNVVLSGITPYFKVAAEMIYGKSVFPDWRKPRPIRDKGLYLAGTIALGNEYRAAFGLPSRPYTPIDWSIVKKSDPLQAAYYSFMSTKQRFMESKGKGEGFFNSPKSEALRNYKEALRYQDEQAAVKYLEQYKLAGGTREGLERSMESMNPTAGLRVSERKEFLASLNPEERRKMNMAQQYFDMVIARSGGALSVTKKGVVDVKVKGTDLPSEKKPKKQNFF